MKTVVLFLTVVLLSFSLLGQSKPNILLIMADDLGFSDLGCYGSEIQTPHIDQLAYEGIRLRQCYNNAICAPSRASLLTGQYPHKAGVGFFNQNLGIPAYQGFLNASSLTLAEVLKQAGYQTYLSGKWHVGNEPAQWPLQRGFEKFFGFLTGASGYFNAQPVNKGANDFFVDGNQKFHPKTSDFYLTDYLTQKGIEFIEKGDKKHPFFLYMAYSSPHWPLQAKSTDIKKYRGKYQIGWDSLRTLRHQKQVQLGLVSADQSPHKDTSLPAWQNLSFDEKQYWVKKMEVYAAMIDNLDQNIGKLIAYLKRTQQFDNTLIIFVSDNGAEGWDFSKMKMAIIRNTGTVGTVGSNESYTKNWSQVSNVPLRSYKSTPYEGGISTPFIARFKGRIPARSLYEGPVHFVDIAPTLFDWANASYPITSPRLEVYPLAGESFKPLLEGKYWQRTSPIFYEWAGHRMVRYQKWKMVSIYPHNKWELYDIQTDRSEKYSLAAQYPEVVQQLEKLYHQWAHQNSVVEWNETLQSAVGFPTQN